MQNYLDKFFATKYLCNTSTVEEKTKQNMSKKHFIALADQIREHNRLAVKNSFYDTFSNSQIEMLADFCKSQNYNFNRERWLAYIKGECGPSGGAVKP